MNMWFEYLKECLFEEIDIVLSLAGIDQQVQGDKNEVNDLIGFISDNIECLSFYEISDENVLIDGHPCSLIKVLSDLVDKKNKVIVIKNNLAINKWIIEKYKEFLYDNGAEFNLDLDILDNFEMTKDTVIVGTKEFINEMKECLDVNVKYFVEEY